VDLAIEGRTGSVLRVEARCGMRVLHGSTTSPAAPASGSGLTDDIVRDKLAAFGDTPFVLGRLDTSRLAPGLHVPVSELKAVRRDLVARLMDGDASAASSTSAGGRAALRLQAAAVAGTLRPQFERPAVGVDAVSAAPALVALCRSDAQLEAVIAAGLPEVELDWMEMTGLGPAVQRARAAGLRVTVATLRVQKPGEESFDQRLARLEPDGVLVRHWGGMVHFARLRAQHPEALAAVRIHGDFSLNVTNSLTARHVLDWGLDTFTVAHDLDEAQLLALLDAVEPERATVVVQHRIATFHTEHCVYSHLLSQGRDFRTCGRPCESHAVALRDHLGLVHPVIVDAGCRNTVFNSQVQSSARLVPRLLERGVRRFRIEFVRETAAEAGAMLAAYRRLVTGAITPDVLLRDLDVAPQQGVSARPMQIQSERQPE
jgi:putative protease